MYGVSSPPSRRSVSAICALGASAGWQQVKMRRSRSSFTSPSGSVALGALVEERGLGVAVIAGCLAAQAVDGAVAGGRGDPAARVRRQSGRRPPLARDDERLLDHLFGDVDVAEETDQGGDDPSGLLTEDPFEVGCVSTAGTGRLRRRRLVLERADLDRAHARGGALRRPRERGVEVGRLDDPEAAELFLRLGERAVGDDRVAAGRRARRSRMLGVVQPAAEHPHARCLELGVERVDLLERLLHDLRGRSGTGDSGLCHTERRYCVMVDGPFGEPTYAGEGRCWFRETVGMAQSERREARAGITIAAATTWVRASVNFVAVWASASTSGTIDSAVSAIVVTRNVRCGRRGAAREHDREDRADERADERQLREPEERDRLAADLDRHVEARRARRRP